MNTLVVYYSLDGNSSLVAGEIKAQTGADILALQTSDEKKRGTLGKFVWGGSMVFMHKKPELKPYSIDIDKYDLVIAGGPVWAAGIAPPLLRFAAQTPVKNKRVAFFSCFMGQPGKSLDQLCAAFPGNEVAGVRGFRSPSLMDAQTLSAEIKTWLEEISRK